MAKIKPLAIIESMSGKVCEHSDMSFVCSKKTGKVHTMKMCNPYEGPASSAQTEVRTKFQQAAATAKQILAATAEDQDQTLYQKKTDYKAQFDAQVKNPSIFSFIVGKEYALIS